MKKDELRFAGKTCHTCNHDIDCNDCDSSPCFKRDCSAHFDGCRETLEPFINNLYEIREMRESKIPWWADHISPAEMIGIIIYDRMTEAVRAEHMRTQQAEKN